MVWLSNENNLSILTTHPTVHSYIYIYVSHVTVTYSHWLPSWGTCIIYANFIHYYACVAAHIVAVTHLVTVHSYTNMDMKHPPFIKKICNRVTGILLYTSILLLQHTVCDGSKDRNSLCDGKRDCTDVAVGQAQADQKVIWKSGSFF